MANSKLSGCFRTRSEALAEQDRLWSKLGGQLQETRVRKSKVHDRQAGVTWTGWCVRYTIARR